MGSLIDIIITDGQWISTGPVSFSLRYRYISDVFGLFHIYTFTLQTI